MFYIRELRNEQLFIRVTKEEKAFILKKKTKSGIYCITDFLMKAVSENPVVNLSLKKYYTVSLEIQKIGTEINALAKNANSTRHISANDYQALTENMEYLDKIFDKCMSVLCLWNHLVESPPNIRRKEKRTEYFNLKLTGSEKEFFLQQKEDAKLNSLTELILLAVKREPIFIVDTRPFLEISGEINHIDNNIKQLLHIAEVSDSRYLNYYSALPKKTAEYKNITIQCLELMSAVRERRMNGLCEAIANQI